MNTDFDTLLYSLGSFAAPLLGLAALALLILLERSLTLLVNQWRGQLPRAARSMVTTYPPAQGEHALELWASEQLSRLGRGLKLLHLIALAAPLIGLLGTVLGLVQSFDALAAQQGPVQPAQLADGLSFAMGTTAAGLAIALPALCGYHGLRHWAEQLLLDAVRAAGWQLLDGNTEPQATEPQATAPGAGHKPPEARC